MHEADTSISNYFYTLLAHQIFQYIIMQAQKIPLLLFGILEVLHSGHYVKACCCGGGGGQSSFVFIGGKMHKHWKVEWSLAMKIQIQLHVIGFNGGGGGAGGGGKNLQNTRMNCYLYVSSFRRRRRRRWRCQLADECQLRCVLYAFLYFLGGAGGAGTRKML